MINALCAMPVMLSPWCAMFAPPVPSTTGETPSRTITFRADAPPGWLVGFDDELTWEEVAPQLDKRFERRPLEGRITIDADRKVAVYIQRPQGPDDRRSIDLSPFDALKPDQLYLIHVQTASISADELKQLKRHKGLRHLSMGPLERVTNADLAPLKEMAWIEDLSLTGPAVTDKRLTILQELPQLKKGGRGLRLLQLNGKEVTDESLRKVAGHTALEILDLTGAAITDDGLKHLEPLTRLKHLRLGATPITGKGLRHLRGAEHLETLGLGKSAVTDDGLAPLKNFGTLKTVWLGDTEITDAGLVHLRTLTDLEVLQLDHTSITGTGFVHLENLDKLRKLYFTGTPVADAGLKDLSELESLEHLWLYGANITDDGLKYLADIPNLKHVSVTQTHVTEEAVEQFRKQHPHLRVTHEPVPVPLSRRRREARERPVVDHSSPQTVFDAYHKAIERQDWEALYETLSPKSRERMLGVLFFSVMAAARGNLESEAWGVLHEYGIDVQRAAREASGTASGTPSEAALRQVDDKPAFFADVVKFLARYDADGEGKPFTHFEYHSLRNVKIEGDQAQGTITVRPKRRRSSEKEPPPGTAQSMDEKAVPLGFRRIEDRWYIALESGIPGKLHGGKPPVRPPEADPRDSSALPPADAGSQPSPTRQPPQSAPAAEPRARSKSAVDHSSPQSVFDAYQKAIDWQNWKQLYATLSPATRERMLGVLFYSLTMAAANRDLRNEAHALLNEHGIDLAKAGREAARGDGDNKSNIDAVLRQVDDKAAFFSDLVQFSVRHDPSGEGAAFTRLEFGSLRDVRIDGDEAQGTATVRVKEKAARGEDQPSAPSRTTTARNVPLRFRRIDERWYIDLEGMSGTQGDRESGLHRTQPGDRQAPARPREGAPPTVEPPPQPK